jgi:hypothetical protein
MASDRLHEEMMAEIQKLLNQGGKPEEVTSNRFSEINDQLRTSHDPTPITVLELRSKSQQVDGHKVFRVGWGYAPTRGLLQQVNEHVVVPINPHLHWSDAKYAPEQFEQVNEPFRVTPRGLNVLDEPPSRSIGIYDYLPVSRALSRITIVAGGEALTFMLEIANSLGMSIDPLKEFNDQLKRSAH